MEKILSSLKEIQKQIPVVVAFGLLVFGVLWLDDRQLERTQTINSEMIKDLREQFLKTAAHEMELSRISRAEDREQRKDQSKAFELFATKMEDLTKAQAELTAEIRSMVNVISRGWKPSSNG